MTPEGNIIVAHLRRAFELLGEHKHEAEVTALLETVIAHVRSMQPMLLLGLPDETPTPLVRREVEGGLYELAREDGKVRLYVCEGNHDTAVALTPLAAIRLRADIAAVAASITTAEQATVAQGGG